jgi:hypothetical protein
VTVLLLALEIISPAGFERYFAELAPLFPLPIRARWTRRRWEP